MSYLYPTAWAIPLGALGIVSILFRFSQFGKGCLLLSAVLLVFRPIKAVLLAFFPTWIAVIIGSVALLAAIRAALTMIFGKQAIDNMVGQLLASGFSTLFGYVGRLIRPLWMVFLPSGRFVRGAISRTRFLPSTLRQNDANMTDPDVNLEQEDAASSMAAGPREHVLGTVVDIGEQVCTLELPDGSLGYLPIETGTSRPALNQTIRCSIVAHQADEPVTLSMADEK